MVVVDCYSKYTTFIAVLADCFVKHIVKIRGVPKSIVSNQEW